MIQATFEGIRLTRKQLEQRRLLAAKDFAQGMKPVDVARKYNAHRSSASRWKRRFDKEGEKGLVARVQVAAP